MNLFPPEEMQRRAAIVREFLGSEPWKIVRESVEAWCESKKNEVIELHAAGDHKEAERLALFVNAVMRVYAEPEIIVSRTSAWLKTWEWLNKIKPKPKKEEARE